MEQKLECVSGSIDLAYRRMHGYWVILTPLELPDQNTTIYYEIVERFIRSEPDILP